MNVQKPHWEELSENWQREQPQTLWRRHCDAVNLAMLQKWWPDKKEAGLSVLQAHELQSLIWNSNPWATAPMWKSIAA